jgi:DNA-binding NarL/FixJ family response regulator
MNSSVQFSRKNPAEPSELRTLEVSLFGLSRKILFLASVLRACVEEQSGKDDLPSRKLRSLAAVANQCVAEVVAISRLPNCPLQPITPQLLADYSRLSDTIEFEAKARRPANLSKREREIVGLLARGQGNKQVAYILGISVRTVEAYRANIRRKLGVDSMSGLMLYAIRNKIVQV